MTFFRTWALPGDQHTSPRECQLRATAETQTIEWSEETVAGPPHAHAGASWTQGFADFLQRGPAAECPPELAEALRRFVVSALA